jgi:hypothetical protein
VQRAIILFLLYGTAALSVAFMDLRSRSHPTFPVDKFIPEVVSGNAPPPARYRVLVPFLLTRLARLTGWPLQSIWYATRLLAFWGSLLVFHVYLRTWFDTPIAILGTFVVAATLPLTFTNSWGHPDDVAELLLFTAACLAIARNWTIAFGLLLALAALNRETSVFLVILFFAAAPLTRQHVVETAAYGALWAFIYAGLRVERGLQTYDPFQVRENWAFLKLLPPAYDPYYRRYAYFGLALFGPLAAIAAAAWARVPRFMKASLLVAPLFAAVCFTFSSIIETRIFTPLYPLVIPAFLVTVARLSSQHSSLPGGGYELAS